MFFHGQVGPLKVSVVRFNPYTSEYSVNAGKYPVILTQLQLFNEMLV